MSNEALIAKARYWVIEDKAATYPPDAPISEEADLIQRLANALEQSEGQIAHCHALLDETFSHPVTEDETLESKIGRCLSDQIQVLKERDILARGFGVLMRRFKVNKTAIGYAVRSKGWADDPDAKAIREALALIEQERL